MTLCLLRQNIFLKFCIAKDCIIFIGFCSCNSFRCCCVVYETSYFCQRYYCYRKNTKSLPQKNKRVLGPAFRDRKKLCNREVAALFVFLFQRKKPKGSKGKANLGSTSSQEEVHTEVCGQVIVLLYSQQMKELGLEYMQFTFQREQVCLLTVCTARE